MMVQCQQRIGGGQGRIEVARRLATGKLLARGLEQTGCARFTLLRQPGREILAVFVVVACQQGCRCVSSELRAAISITLQRAVTLDQRVLEQLPEAQQLLAQIAPRIVRIGPEHRGHAQPADAGLQRGKRQQCSGAALERDNAAVRQHNGRVAKEANPHFGTRCRLLHGRIIADANRSGQGVKRHVHPTMP